MAITITTNDKDGQAVSTVYQNREEVLKAVQPKVEETQGEPSASKQKNENNESQEPKQNKEEAQKDEFDYLNSSDEDDHNEDEDDLDIEDEDDAEEEQKPKKNGFKKRIDKLTKRNSEYEARIAQLEAEIKGRNPNNGETQEQTTSKEKIEELNEPKIEDFEQYNDYIKALAKYELNEEKKAIRLKEQNEAIQKEAEKITQNWVEKVKDAKAFYGEDKWNSLSKVDLPLSVEMRAELMQSEIGPHILFYLFHNQEETKKIYNMTPAQQIRELAKLEIKVANKLPEVKQKKEEVKTSKAPAPVKPIESKTEGKVSKDPSKMSYQEHKAWMNSRRKK